MREFLTQISLSPQESPLRLLMKVNTLGIKADCKGLNFGLHHFFQVASNNPMLCRNFFIYGSYDMAGTRLLLPRC